MEKPTAYGSVLILVFSIISVSSKVEADEFDVVDRPAEIDCPASGMICFSAKDEGTVELPPFPLASIADRQLGDQQFFRLDNQDQTPWTLDLNAKVWGRALAGNAIVLVYDGLNPSAVSNREVIELLQAVIPAGSTLSARISLSPNDGIRPGRPYLIRVVQLISGREAVLAQGKVFLQ